MDNDGGEDSDDDGDGDFDNGGEDSNGEGQRAPETAHMVPTNLPSPVVGAMSP